MADKVEFEDICMKKQKRNDGTSSADDLILLYKTKIMHSKDNLKVILADEYINPVPMTKAYVGFIKDVKNISNTIKVLNEKLPLKELIHLKRVRGPNIIISHVNSFEAASSIQEFIQSNVPELADVFEFFREIDVPAFMPKLKWQYSLLVKKWACNFHPDIYLEKLTSGDIFADTLHSHRTYMAMNFEIIKWYCKTHKVDITEEVLNSSNASVVVDPSINSVVAVSFDNRLEHPVQHAAMVAIDNVAKTQDGGAWSSENTDDITLSGINKDLLKHLKEYFPEVKFGPKKYFSKDTIDSDGVKDYSGPYLCTNYNIYVLREPCVMCSMALTHARVKRVFFCKENKELGALSSRVKLHTVPYLNHRFEVFTGFL